MARLLKEEENADEDMNYEVAPHRFFTQGHIHDPCRRARKSAGIFVGIPRSQVALGNISCFSRNSISR
jgi:hypothetical protein